MYVCIQYTRTHLCIFYDYMCLEESWTICCLNSEEKSTAGHLNSIHAVQAKWPSRLVFLLRRKQRALRWRWSTTPLTAMWNNLQRKSNVVSGHSFRNVKQVGLTVCFLCKVIFVNGSQVIMNIFEVDDASEFSVKHLRLEILSINARISKGLNPLVWAWICSKSLRPCHQIHWRQCQLQTSHQMWWCWTGAFWIPFLNMMASCLGCPRVSVWWRHKWRLFSMALVVCGNLGPWLVNWPPLLWALALSKVARKPPISLQSLNWFIMAWPMFRWVIKQVVKVNLMSPRFMVHLLGVLARWLVLMEADSQVNWS